ncbi:C40 family peptidase [Desulfosporosinus nitroreducens]|uniref:C40 family peptidase n=1 Tax=Desulfosporosinus nitroreducens TaxID=2018668 RepID=UPI00207D27DA|nr:C40 family peptidase [Desulfosporosinus nitroreducens]MCO1599817.1 C40 family peptidase [Desulfosporosinus nitroreducens]
MSQLSDYLENALINAVLRNTAYSSPVTVYAALFTSDPTDAGTGTEVTGGAYVRMPVAFTDPTDGQTSNSADVLFPIATANWGTITHVGLYDALSGGNLLFHAPLEFSKVINISSQFKVPQNYLIVRLK